MMHRRRMLGLFASVLLLAGGLTGCWDNRPIDQRSFVLIMGVWPAGKHNVELALQIPTAQGLTSLQGAGFGGGSLGAPSYVLTARAPTMLGALAEAEGQSDRDIYLGQVVLVVVSTRLSPIQFRGVMNTLMRLGPFDKIAYMAATNLSAAQFMKAQSVETAQPALYFLSLFSCSRCTPVNMSRTVWDTEQAVATPGEGLALPLVGGTQNGYRIDRLVLYEDDRPAVVLTPRETAMLSFAMNRTSKAVVSLPASGGVPISVRSVDAKARSSTRLVHGRLHITVSLSL